MNAATKIRPALRTLREALVEWGWEDLAHGVSQYTLDHEYVGEGFPVPCTAGKKSGALQVTCGGPVLFVIPKANDRIRGNLYVVFDDSLGERWDTQSRQGVPAHERTPTHYRPSPRLRIVESG